MTRDQLVEFIALHLQARGIEVEVKINDNHVIADLGGDELDWQEIIAELHSNFDVQLDNADTIGHLVMAMKSAVRREP